MTKFEAFRDINTPFQQAWDAFLSNNPSHEDITDAIFHTYNLTYLNGGNTRIEMLTYLEKKLQEHQYESNVPHTDYKHLGVTSVVLACLFKQPFELSMTFDRPLVQRAKFFYHRMLQHEEGAKFINRFVEHSRVNQIMFQS